ncbi:MAG: hypothetical protein Q7P63_12940 [Verrucomicrobiota bacterium JB022]|nr:hypothetical protein [Verrucomicrobiota bacterium JB022]
MSWNPLTLTILQRYLAAPQLRALQTAALADAQGDPLPELIADVTARVRAELRAGGNRLSADPQALPAELHGPAAALVLATAQTRLPTLELRPDQVRAYQDARALLERFATGRLRPEAPDDPETAPAPTSGQTVVVSARSDRLTARRLRF